MNFWKWAPCVSKFCGECLGRVNAGTKIDRRILVSRTGVERGRFMGHRSDVHREDLCTCSAGCVGGRTRVRICLFRGSAAADSLRQHEAGGGQDSGGGERKKTRAVNCRATAYLRRSSDVRARATTRGRWKGWWAMRGGTLWCRFHGGQSGGAEHTSAGTV